MFKFVLHHSLESETAALDCWAVLKAKLRVPAISKAAVLLFRVGCVKRL